MEYTKDYEQVIKQEGEKAEALSILHLNASSYFNKFYVFINLPIIFLSSIIGLLNALDLFEYQNYVFSVIFVLLGVFKSVDSFFSFAKRSETHRLISLNYKKIHKLICIQLSIERDKRINAKSLQKIIMNDIENITSQEPLIPSRIINNFKKRYKDYNTALPACCNGLTDIKIHIENTEERIIIKNQLSTDSTNSEPYSDA